MSKQTTSASVSAACILLVAAVLFACMVGISSAAAAAAAVVGSTNVNLNNYVQQTQRSAPLVGSSPSEQQRVYDFVVSSSGDNSDSVSWTAFGRTWTVDLELTDVVADNTDYYHGVLEGEANAAVSFALLPGSGLSGMIVTGATTYWIRRLPVTDNGDEDGLAVFMLREQMGQDVIGSLPVFGEPLVDADSHADESGSNSNEARTTTSARITSYKVGVMFDQNWATASNNPWSSQANTVGLFNDVNAIYKAQGLGTFTAVYLKQVATTSATTSTTDMLNYFTDTVSTTVSAMSDTSYTNYVWLVGSNVGGLSWVGTTCQGSKAAQNKKTSVIGLVSYSRLWTVKTIAHELGHTRGASHVFTDQCSSTMTTGCQCSIMSYCFPTATNNPSGAVNIFAASTITEMQAAGCY